MARNDIVNSDGSLNYDKLGDLPDKISVLTGDNLSRAINIKYPPSPLVGVVMDGVTDDSVRLQAIIDSISSTGGTLIIPSGKILLTGVVIKSDNISIIGSGNSTNIINGINDLRGTDSSLFLFKKDDYLTEITTLSDNLSSTSKTITVTDATGLSIDDIISFNDGTYASRNISIIRQISGSTITLDRGVSNNCLSGSKVYKMNTIKNCRIGNFYIDFNGKYGYGVFVYGGQNILVDNIYSKNIGSKVVQFSSTFDSHIENVSCDYGFDVADAGGHSYLIRLAVSNDVSIKNCKGFSLRHVVDCTSSSRNFISDCEGYDCFSSDFLTHGNNCKYNIYTDCKSITNQTSAYSFDEANGDTQNSVIGGYVEGSSLLYRDQLGTTSITGLTVRSSNSQYTIPYGGVHTYKNCHFICDYPLISGILSDGIKIRFINCSFDVSTYRGIAHLSAITNNITVEFIDCDIIVTASLGIFEGGTSTTVRIINSRITVKSSLGTNALFNCQGNIESIGTVYDFEVAGSSYIFGIYTGNLIIEKNKFKNVTNVWKRIGINPLIKLGNNTYESTVLPSLSNCKLTTIGVLDVSDLSGLFPPISGTWLKGANVMSNSISAGGYVGYINTVESAPGTWKGYGLIQS